jgi:hypothetical protein
MADHDDPDETVDFETFAAEAREYAAGKNRERMAETRFGSTRDVRADRGNRPDNPRNADERHRQEHGADQEQRLQAIADPARQAETRAQVEKHYEAWGKALEKAHYQRFETSDRICERKLAERKIDLRLIPEDQKEAIRKEAVRESVAQSKNRMAEINTALPAMIDNTIGTSLKLSHDRSAPLDKDAQRAKDAAAEYNSRVRQSGHDRGGKDHER